MQNGNMKRKRQERCRSTSSLGISRQCEYVSFYANAFLFGHRGRFISRVYFDRNSRGAAVSEHTSSAFLLNGNCSHKSCTIPMQIAKLLHSSLTLFPQRFTLLLLSSIPSFSSHFSPPLLEDFFTFSMDFLLSQLFPFLSFSTGTEKRKSDNNRDVGQNYKTPDGIKACYHRVLRMY